MTAQRELRSHYIIAPKSQRLQSSDRNIDYRLGETRSYFANAS